MQSPPPGPPYSQPPYPPHGHPQHGRPRAAKTNWLAVLIIVGFVGLIVLGTLAAIAIPAFTKYTRRSKTSEARVNLAKMFDAASSYYTEHGQCPDHDGAQGRAGVTPNLSVDCGEGEGGRCQAGGAGGGVYPQTDWTANPVWSALGFEVRGGHYYRYDFRWKEEDGMCMFTAQAFGDLDEDGVFSTFERSGAADINGVNAAAGLYIDQEVE